MAVQVTGQQPKPVPQGKSSGCGCLSFIVVLAIAAAGVGIFFGVRDANDAFDGIGDVFDSDPDFDDERFDGPRVELDPVEPGSVVRQQLGDDEVGVHPIEGVTGTVTFRAFGNGSFDPFIRVVAADGDVLDEDDDGGDSRDSLLTIDLSDEPGAELLVTNFNGAPGPYTLIVLDGDGTVLPDEGAELELGARTPGLIVQAGDAVAHPFTGTGAPVSITVEQVDSFDPVVTVFDAAGNQLATNDDFSTETERDARVDLTIPAGTTVSVEVSGFGSSVGPYVVTVDPTG